ncbi:hypothetical protein ACNUDN_03532 [Mycobacterium sp. smrl_JER01]
MRPRTLTPVTSGMRQRPVMAVVSATTARGYAALDRGLSAHAPPAKRRELQR